MKSVEAPHSALNPIPSMANIEYMTQPMGPLEEGDQALVDAVAAVPSGVYIGDQNGKKLIVSKRKELGKESISAQMTGPQGVVTDGATAVIRYAPSAGVPAVTADKARWIGNSGYETLAHAADNDIQDGPTFLNTKRDRPQAQAIKQDVANRINETFKAVKLATDEDIREFCQ